MTVKRNSFNLNLTAMKFEFNGNFKKILSWN